MTKREKKTWDIGVICGVTLIMAVMITPVTTLAYTFNIVVPNTTMSAPPTENGNDDVDPYDSYTPEGANYTCKYIVDTWSSSSITMETYDLENNKLTENDLTIDPGNELTAGMSIGVNVYETKRIYASALFYVEYTPNSTCTNYKTTCTCDISSSSRFCFSAKDLLSINLEQRIKMLAPSIGTLCKFDVSCNGWNCSPSCSGSKTCHPDEKNQCTSWSNPKPRKVTSDTDSRYITCRDYVLGLLNNGVEIKEPEATYQIYLNDSNNYNAANDPEDPAKQIIGKKDCGNDECQDIEYEFGESDEAGVWTISTKANKHAQVRYNYHPNAVCMNIKDSKVRYLLGSETKCSDDEFEIANDKNSNDNYEHWHYFIPLNTKSSTGFSISVLHSKSKKLWTPEVCNKVIDENKNDYQNIMIDGDFIPLIGGNDDESIEIAKKQIQESGGCYLQTVIHIPVKQKFYNEVITQDSLGNNEATFNGFNFYYKQIDINEPFPNGLPTIGESLWTKWDADGRTSPNISQSYSSSSLSYIAQNINYKTVREYNENNFYTSWSNMNKDGTSNFIEKEGIIERITTTTGYKLGCGPLNENQYLDADKTIKNIFYQAGCSK